MAAEMQPGDLELLREMLAIAEKNAASPVPEGELVRVYHLNRGGGSFTHGEYHLAPGGSALVPMSVADLWLGHTDGTGSPHIALSLPGDAVKEDKLAKENTDLKGKVSDLDAQLKGLQTMLEAAKAAGFAPPPAQ